MHKIIISQKTDQGKVRQNNEDSLASVERKGTCLFMIADGLGGLERGEVASREAISEMQKLFQQTVQVFNKNWLQDAFQKVNATIFNFNEPLDASEWMATTLTVSQFFKDHLYIGHVGDCRVYQIRKDKITCLTVDHAIGRHILSRAIGTHATVEADIYETTLEVNDIYVQCSDGLYSMVSDKEIMEAVKNFSPDKSTERLIFLANQNGGVDNISLQVISILPA